MRNRRVLALVMAGGKGARLFPLTRDRSKPAVPFGGKYRIVDFVLSNLVNSGVFSIYALVQYKSQSLIEHLRTGWRPSGLLLDHFVTVVPPQMRFLSEVWYRGTADAVSQNLNLIGDFDPEVVAIFGADHVYRMDIGAMLDFHVEREAHATVAAIPIPLALASGFGVIEADAAGRVSGFEEKPQRPKPRPADPSTALGSMGNYLFDRRVLEEILLEDLRRSTEHDFGRTILPDLCERSRVFAYDFTANAVPGTKPTEEPAYWRDVGTLPSYFDAHMDLLGPAPRFDLGNRRWPIHGVPGGEAPSRIHGGEVRDALLGEGTVVRGAKVERSILGPGVVVEEGAEIAESIVLAYTRVGRGARLRRAIVDRHNRIADGDLLGIELDRDRRLGRHVDASGLVVLPRGPTRTE
ncbi:MAG TPA: glucose-1-phosphate adenylyltransferase [Planctomycetota bacterium]|jgi:glucose-1-phosphate adenylyltransferase|nr:glucose-1-phosphate adenylyltransferase [Planctomycetota bacterium]